MHADHFEIRLARVRHRFATTLESKITDAFVSADHMTRGESGVIGPTVGFAATALMQAHREKRGLTEREVLSLKRALENLRVAAASELRMMYQRGG